MENVQRSKEQLVTRERILRDYARARKPLKKYVEGGERKIFPYENESFAEAIDFESVYEEPVLELQLAKMHNVIKQLKQVKEGQGLECKAIVEMKSKNKRNIGGLKASDFEMLSMRRQELVRDHAGNIILKNGMKLSKFCLSILCSNGCW